MSVAGRGYLALLFRGRLWPGRWAGPWRVWGALLLLALSWLPAQAAQRVTLLLSEAGGVYQACAQAIATELARTPGPWVVHRQTLGDGPPPAVSQEGVVVAVGVKALRHALARRGDGPLFSVLVPALAVEKLLAEFPGHAQANPVFALYLDQPHGRQFGLIRLAMPEVRRVGVLLGPSTAPQADGIAQAGRDAGLEVTVRTIQTPEQLFAQLNDATQAPEAILVSPDPLVVGPDTLRALFLQTYRLGVPVVAYSAGLVRAGAMLGVYSTPEQQGGELGRWLRERPWERGRPGLLGRYPARFSVDVNRNVARSLEWAVPREDALRERLLDGEGR